MQYWDSTHRRYCYSINVDILVQWRNVTLPNIGLVLQISDATYISCAILGQQPSPLLVHYYFSCK